ncbi:MAG: hypothetical protein GPJ01_06115 [Microcystis aeruginosa LL13-06]|nr:hypothetical protein [Microcystis aeruginosa LL13-06]
MGITIRFTAVRMSIVLKIPRRSLNAVQPSTSQLYLSRRFLDNLPLSPATARKITI